MLSEIVQPGSPEFLIVCLLVLAVGVNLLAYLAFRDDQLRAAAEDEWYYPGSLLMLLPLFGGWIGAKIGQRTNKIRARSFLFNSLLNLIIAVEIVALIWFVSPLPEIIHRATGWNAETFSSIWTGFLDNLLVWNGENVNDLPQRFGPRSTD